MKRDQEDLPQIEVRGLSMGYGDTVLLKDLNFSISRKEIFIIIGGSGSGKSTLMRHLIGLHKPLRGDILVGGESFVTASSVTHDHLTRRLGVMYQGGALWSSMTLAENVALPLEQFTQHTKARIDRIIAYKLSLVGLAGYEHFYPAEISGGMAKRASVARALALDPEVLFLDEPSSGLDPVSARRMDDLILELRDSLGMTVVIVTHALESVFLLGDKAVFLDNRSDPQGTVGKPADLRDHSENDTIRNFLNRGAIKHE